MPVYFAGWVRADATVKWGSGFTAIRYGVQGWYRIIVPATTTGRNLIAVVTPVVGNAIARVSSITKSATDGSFTIEIEIHDPTNGNYVDSDFTFIAIDRS